MIELAPDQPRGMVEFRARGTVQASDYERVLVPAVERVLSQEGSVRLLGHYGPDFEGYDLGAALDDVRFGLRHWRGFERVAVVTDVRWLAQVVKAVGFTLPCPVKVFANDALDDARRWLRESLGSVQLVFDDAADTLTARLLGQLEPGAYDGVRADLDAWLARRDRMRLVLDLREFRGWGGPTALFRHLGIVRGLRDRPERVAIVGEPGWQRLAAQVASQLVRAEVRWFPKPELDRAERWVRS